MIVVEMHGMSQDTGLFGFYGESDEATLDGYLDELLFAVVSSGPIATVEAEAPREFT